jgi:hypothetical protein
MASSQSISVSSNSFSRWASHYIFLFKYHFLLHILRFLFLFSVNIMTDVASKQQTTASFLSTIVTRTRRHTELTRKTDKPDWKRVLCQRTFSSVFRAVFTQLKLQCLTYNVWGPKRHRTQVAKVLYTTDCVIYSRMRNAFTNPASRSSSLNPGTHYPHVTWSDIKLTFYFQLLPYSFPCVGSHMLISIIWCLGVT